MAENNPNGIQEWVPKTHGLASDIIPSYRFSVYMMGMKLGFSKISNMEILIETDPLVEGGCNSYPHSLQRPVSREKTLIMERGVQTSSVTASISQRLMSLISKFDVGKRLKMDLIITVNRWDGSVEKLYKVQGATVKRWKCSDLNAMSSQPLIETFEITYEKLEEDQEMGFALGAVGLGGL